MALGQQSLGQQLQDNNLAQSLNKQTLGLAQGINSFETTVPQLGLGARPQHDPSSNYAKGGIVKGPGTGTSDSIPAKLPVESAIIPAHIVKLYGKDYFDKLEAAAPKSGDTKGKVDAKISNGEYQLSPDAVKYWGQNFITKLIGSDNEASESNDSPVEESADMQHYREGGVVEQPPSLRDRALNTADSNAAFRQSKPDFGAKFAQDNAPAPSLSERTQTNIQPSQPAQTGLRGRLGMPESTVAPNPPQLGLRERLTADANSIPQDQVAQSGLRGRLGMADNTPEPVQPQPSLRDRVFSESNNTVRPGFGKNLPDSSVQMPKANPWETEMQGAGGQGLGAKIGSGLNKFAGAAGAAGSLAGIAALAAEPSEGDNYLEAKAARGDKQAQQALATGGFNPIADRMKAPINAGLAAAGNAINDNVVQPVVGGVKRLLGGNQAQPSPEAATGSFGAKPNATPQPEAQPAPAADQANGLAKVATNPQPAPNPTLSPQNQYASVPIEGGNRLQLTPEYNAQLNAKDTRTIAQRDASNATPEQISGQPAAGGFGARANDDYLTQRQKILDQNMEYNRQLSAMSANRAANGLPQINPAFTDTTVDPERNFGAKQRLAYDELAQNDRHANQTNALGRDELNHRIKTDDRKLDVEENLKNTEHAAQPGWIDFFSDQTTPEQKTKLAGWLAKNDPKGWLAYQKKVNQ